MFLSLAPRNVTVDRYAVAHDALVAGRRRHGAAQQPHVLRVVPGQDHGVGKHEDCPQPKGFPGNRPWKIHSVGFRWYLLGGEGFKLK